MSSAVLQLWEFKDAPDSLRRLVSLEFAGGYLALIRPGAADEVVQGLLTHWNSSGMSVLRYDIGDGGTVLAGPDPSPSRS